MTNEEITEALAEVRKNKHISKRKLAQKAHLTQSTIQKFFTCGSSPKLQTVVAVAEALGLQVEIRTKRETNC